MPITLPNHADWGKFRCVAVDATSQAWRSVENEILPVPTCRVRIPMAALRERQGERARVPEEVRSVAAGVLRQMGERTDEGRLIGF